MRDSTDAALAAEGDYEAFERLYRRYLSRTYSLCTRLSGSRAKGRELTAEVFVKAWEKLPQFSGESAFASWLHRLATDVVLTSALVDEMVPDTVDQASSASERSQDAARTAGADEELDVSLAIDRLPANARTILVLHDVEGYKYDDIAEIFGITVGGSKARLHRARVLLRELLSR
jgi:RNA polymerase sigma-70 factor (ECF subfamily)